MLAAILFHKEPWSECITQFSSLPFLSSHQTPDTSRWGDFLGLPLIEDNLQLGKLYLMNCVSQHTKSNQHELIIVILFIGNQDVIEKQRVRSSPTVTEHGAKPLFQTLVGHPEKVCARYRSALLLQPPSASDLSSLLRLPDSEMVKCRKAII